MNVQPLGAARRKQRGGAAPHSTGENAPAFEVPSGACDCHMHFFDPALPFAPGPVLQHGLASPEDYGKLKGRLGIDRNVIVQPSSYGRDHRVLLTGLRSLEGTARGVAVVGPDVNEAELRTLDDHGVVGVRFNLVQKGANTAAMLEDVAAKIAPFGWHLQLHAHPKELLDLADRLLALPIPVVIDHFAFLNVEPELTTDVAGATHRLLGSGRVWMKLSAPYIASPDSDAYEDLDAFVRQLADESLDQLVWGTDWPHVTMRQKPDDAVLMNLLARWLSHHECRQVLVDNPQRLYRS